MLPSWQKHATFYEYVGMRILHVFSNYYYFDSYLPGSNICYCNENTSRNVSIFFLEGFYLLVMLGASPFVSI